MTPVFEAAKKEADCAPLDKHAQIMHSNLAMTYGALSGMNFREILPDSQEGGKADSNGANGNKNKNKYTKRPLEKVKKACSIARNNTNCPITFVMTDLFR
jgi:hypothetical protein